MAKKKSKRGAEANQFEPRLLQAPAHEAVRALQEAADKAEALLRAWTDSANVEAVVAVAEDEATPSALRKAARRELGVLKSRGVAIPDRKRVEPKAAAAAETLEAWFMPQDPSGVATITIARSSTGGRKDVVEVRIQDYAGVVEVRPGEASRSSMREAFKAIQARFGFSPAPVPVPWARWQVAQAKQRNARSGFVLPLGFDTAASLLEPVPESAPLHPIDELGIQIDDAAIAQAVSNSATLHQEPEFGTWLPEPRVVHEMLQKVGERLTGNEDADNENVTKFFAEETAAAADRFFTQEVREVVAARMKDAAITINARAGKERAALVLATAEAVKRAGLITSPPSEVPFMVAFINKALGRMAAAQNGRLSIPVPQRNQSQAVVAPPEAIEAAARTRAGEPDESQPTEEPPTEQQPAPEGETQKA